LMDPSASAHREPSPLNSMYLRAFMCCKPSYAFLSPMDPCTCVCREPSFIACWTHASACAMSEAVPAQLSADPSLIHGFLHADAWLIRFPAGGPSQLCFHFISALLQPSFGLASAIVAASLYSPQLRRSMRPGAWPLGGLYGLQHGALQLRHLCFGAPLLDDLRLYGLCGLHGPPLRPDTVCGSALYALRLDCSHDLQLAAVYDPPSGTPRLSGLRSSLLTTIRHSICAVCSLAPRCLITRTVSSLVRFSPRIACGLTLLRLAAVAARGLTAHGLTSRGSMAWLTLFSCFVAPRSLVVTDLSSVQHTSLLLIAWHG
jgi:hypothetical protein